MALFLNTFPSHNDVYKFFLVFSVLSLDCRRIFIPKLLDRRGIWKFANVVIGKWI